MNYLMIDCENSIPKNLNKLNKNEWTIVAFIGAKQHSFSTVFAMQMQSFGNNGKYVKVNHSGKNSLDFHLTFEMGRICQQDNSATFHIYSNDQGFDPLVKSLNDQGYAAFRSVVIQ